MAFNGELFEIFSQLPAKSIFKLASVAKCCDEFSSEDLFVKKQSQNMVHKNNSAFFMQQSSYQMFMGVPEFHVMPGEENSSGVSNKSLDFLRKFGRLLGSSNGLVCCRKASEKSIDNELFICNPATQRWLCIPDPWRFQEPKPVCNVVFQCNMGPSDEFPSNNFLMVLQPTEFWSSDLMCKIYSPAEGIWEERGLINFGARRILFESLVYQKGVFYFLSDCLTSHWTWKRAEKVCSHKCWGSVLFHPYSNTLRPCGDGATPDPK
ncbi:hypothetical protein RHSIM_Rhsim10G0180500 [Rhododendron simsii]|uniref:F-box protein n=1 Tax=Rhododendron simsii TaxID=118357 RepID=A0A834GBT3_RHOSS|nr:hypothetical protein RHSIM_Rhsim10G0180500 [Rhododendron simsii]